ncbi:hypothetical protein ACHAPT_012995 [Fusarium lateritium]
MKTGDQCLDDEFDEWWDHDPSSIPHLTDALLSNLEQSTASTELSSTFSQLFDQLPNEIKDEILSFLIDEDLALNCNYVLPQSFWRETFDQVPFVWDLDWDVVGEMEQVAESGGFEWDWEKMTRQLMARVTIVEEVQDECGDYEVLVPWSYEKVGLIIPPGFNSRRRIWQILSEMYPSDVGMVHHIAEDGEDSADSTDSNNSD